MHINYRFSHVLQGTMDFSFSEYRYWIVFSGNGRISYKDGTIFLATHDVLEIPMDYPFTLECITQMQLGIIEIFNFAPGNRTFQKKGSDETELIRKTFLFAIDYSGFESPYSEQLKYHLDTLMYETLLKTGLNEYKINPQIANFLDILNQHVFEPDFDMMPYIKATGYSKSHFHKLFHDTTGLSPVEFVHSNRIDRAKKLMKQSQEYTIKEIATLCGYTDVYYFSRMFRKKTGMSPSQYASQQKYN